MEEGASMRLEADSSTVREQHIEIVLPYEQLDDVDYVVVHVHMPYLHADERPQSKSVRFVKNG